MHKMIQRPLGADCHTEGYWAENTTSQILSIDNNEGRKAEWSQLVLNTATLTVRLRNHHYQHVLYNTQSCPKRREVFQTSSLLRFNLSV